MRVVITGGCGFLGRRLAHQLLAREDIAKLILFDNAVPSLPLPEDRRMRLVTGDIADRKTLRRVIAPGTDAVFHLAAVVSAGAEADTDLGYRVNLDGTRAVLEACRALGTCPRVVFASSLAVYGGALPPQVGDYTRKGFIDGRALRLPTVVVRPGRPNRAASAFASSMIRDPLTGYEAVCPVAPETVMALASPRRVVAALIHALALPGEAFGANRSLQLPGYLVTVAEIAAAVRRAGGEAAYAHIRWQHDPAIEAIIGSWPQALAAPRAKALGFADEDGIDAAIAAFLEDDFELQQKLVG